MCYATCMIRLRTRVLRIIQRTALTCAFESEANDTILLATEGHAHRAKSIRPPRRSLSGAPHIGAIRFAVRFPLAPVGSVRSDALAHRLVRLWDPRDFRSPGVTPEVLKANGTSRLRCGRTGVHTMESGSPPGTKRMH